MDIHLLNRKFEFIGARVKFIERPKHFRQSPGTSLALNIGNDRHGEYFEMLSPPNLNSEVEVIDTSRSDRHLLLLVREKGFKNKYLCGHDERHWFVAGIPETASVGTVLQAKEALQPQEVQCLGSSASFWKITQSSQEYRFCAAGRMVLHSNAQPSS